jgi:hypothetical protein
MLISTNEVANRLKITNRAVQNKCKQYGIVKIGNQYQITKEIAEQWYKDLETNIETKTKRSNEISKTSHRSDKKSSLLFWFSALVGATAVIMLYLNLDSQIKETKKELQKEQTEHKTDVKELRKIVDTQKDIISNKEIEIQRLKLKDSLRLFKP